MTQAPCVIDRVKPDTHIFRMIRRLALLITLTVGTAAFAQPNSTTVRLANLEQDVRILQQHLGSLRIELEAALRENNRLRQALEQELSDGRKQYVSLNELNRRLASLTTELQRTLSESQKATIAQVGAQVDSLAQQTQKALEALAKSVESRPQVTAPPVFHDNFPKNGISYTVKSGDSLGKIARENNSSIDWIRNANHIAGDVIYPEQQLFIPQRN